MHGTSEYCTRWAVVFLVIFVLIMMCESEYQNPPGMKAPWPAGLGFRCNQGNFGTFSHNEPSSFYAWDFGLPTGTPVVAVSSGTVNSAGYDEGGYGIFLIIKHKNGLYSVYGHLEEICAGVGQFVPKGLRIGYSGSTGNATGPHLHFSILDGRGNSLPSMFADIGVPEEGFYYVSGNCAPM